MEQPAYIPTLHLFPVLDDLLVGLLTSLNPEDWHKPTLAKRWRVKDVAAHLLDGNIRAIAAMHRYEPPFDASINSYQDLVDYLNELNAVWVNAMKRASTQWLTDQLRVTGATYLNYLQTLDPFGKAKFSVAWAGEEQSLNWFHIAREYTEKWHHQQQIREAVGREAPLMTKELFYPCIATFMMALPYAYRNIKAVSGTRVTCIISGEAGGTWDLIKTDKNWAFADAGSLQDPSVQITIRPEIAWRLFTKAIPATVARSLSLIEGDDSLADGIFAMLSVMA